jgi:dTDP-4-dehydrorhamnose 3,5-epimerase-like enzyme
MSSFSGHSPGFGSAVQIFEVHGRIDERGRLYPLEFAALPFRPERLFFVRPSKAGVKRGGHVRATAHQLLVCVSGRIDTRVTYEGEMGEFSLNRPGMALYLMPGVWAEQTYVTKDATLLVLSSEPYQPGDSPSAA